MKTKPILFLDIDGVLNSNAWWSNPARPKVKDNIWEPSHIDPTAVNLLDTVLVATGAEVVVSSSWRNSHTVEQIATLLADKGLSCPERLVGKTPDIWTFHPDIRDKFGETRGVEIAMWLLVNRPDGAVFAIVDDDGDMWELAPRWVWTPHAEGLTQETADRLAALLSETVPFVFPKVAIPDGP